MKLTLSAIGIAVALVALPAVAQDAVPTTGGLFWTPTQVEAPVPHERAIEVASVEMSTTETLPAAVATVRPVARAVVPVVQPVAAVQQPLFRMDRFWVIGSFR